MHKKVLRCSGSLIYMGVMECRRRAQLLPHRSTAAPSLSLLCTLQISPLKFKASFSVVRIMIAPVIPTGSGQITKICIPGGYAILETKGSKDTISLNSLGSHIFGIRSCCDESLIFTNQCHLYASSPLG